MEPGAAWLAGIYSILQGGVRLLTAKLFSPGSLEGVWVGFPFIGSWGQVGVGRLTRPLLGRGGELAWDPDSGQPFWDTAPPETLPVFDSPTLCRFSSPSTGLSPGPHSYRL